MMRRQILPTALILTAVALLNPANAEEPRKPTSAESVIQVQLVDDSVIKLSLLDSQIAFQTTYGTLNISVSEIRKLELGLRISDETASQIRAVIADLGNPQQRKREEAAALLLKHREKAYPALKEATRSTDAEVAKRAEDLIEKLEELVPEGKLEVPEHDVIHTDKSKIAGKILSPAFKARSFAFGELTLKLSDVRAMSVSGFEVEKPAVAALPDPGSLTGYRNPQHVGKTFTFTVTGAVGGSVWGTGIYTLDSTLASAAVHMGVLKVGETGKVTVTILGPTRGFIGSTQNGVTTSNYDSYPGAYQIHPKGGRAPGGR
jgi:hypothetical protein